MDFQSVRPAEFDSAALLLHPPYDKENQRTKCPLGAPARGPCSIATTGEQSARVFRKRTLRESQTTRFSARAVRNFLPAAPMNARPTRR